MTDPLPGWQHRTADTYPWENPMTQPDQQPVDRPNPLTKAASTAGAVWAAVAAIIGVAVQLGVLSAAQGTAISSIGEALPGWITAVGVIAGAVVPLVGALLAAFRTAAAGRDDVTPVADPRDNDGTRLVRAAVR